MAVLKVWKAHGLDCRIVESGEFVGGYQSKNGYVGLPKGHPYWGKDSYDLPIDAPGGITFSNQGQETDEMFPNPELWWVGFDTNHWNKGDYDPIYKRGHKWTLEEVSKKTDKMAAQIASV